MNRISFIIGLLLLVTALRATGQTINLYDRKVKEAEQYYRSKEYLKAAVAYNKAFASNKNLGRIDHRYQAARCWALAGEPDSAFHNLEKIAEIGYTKHYITTHDSTLISIHNDQRWKSIINTIKSNKEKSEPNLNELLAAQLDTIFLEDQTYRNEINKITQQYGFQSKEMQAHGRVIRQKDSANVIKVQAILDKYGWLGKDVVGETGNSTLFFVIQHADKATQEKYLPMLRDAVKKGKATASNLALLEDRVAIKQGKKQIYGSQITQDPKTGAYYVSPLEDPENVDKRRAEVELPPLSEYVKQWGIKWTLEEYYKNLAEKK